MLSHFFWLFSTLLLVFHEKNMKNQIVVFIRLSGEYAE